MQRPFEINEHIKPACLPTKPVTVGSTCYVSGWGGTRPKVDKYH